MPNSCHLRLQIRLSKAPEDPKIDAESSSGADKFDEKSTKCVFRRTGAFRDTSEPPEGAFKSIPEHALDGLGAILGHGGTPQIMSRPAKRVSGEPPESSGRHQDMSPTRSKRQTLFEQPSRLIFCCLHPVERKLRSVKTTKTSFYLKTFLRKNFFT